MQALYRKYRPQVFDDVVGQDFIATTLLHALQLGKVSHAYLFCGPRGTGKTTIARLLSKALLCTQPSQGLPCGMCDDCTLISEGEHPDVYELDAASRTGVENVREEIIGRVNYAPTRGTNKVYIIDEVHMLSVAAFNALLKTLEEPPSHVVFILCTTDPQKVPQTVQSRCQRYDFSRISSDDIASRLRTVCSSESFTYDDASLMRIAEAARGGMRDALGLLEQAAVFNDGDISVAAVNQVLGEESSDACAALLNACAVHDYAGIFDFTEAAVAEGEDFSRLAVQLTKALRSEYVTLVRAQKRNQPTSQQRFGKAQLEHMLDVCADLLTEMKTTSDAQLSFELACLKLARLEGSLTLQALEARIEALESAPSLVNPRSEVQPARNISITDNTSRLVEHRSQNVAGATPRVNAGQVPTQQEDDYERVPLSAYESVPVSAYEQDGVSFAKKDAFGGASTGKVAAEYASVGNTSGEHAPCRDDARGELPHVEEVAHKVASSESSTSLSPSMVEKLQNPAACQRGWQSALSTMKRLNVAYAALLMGVKVSFDVPRETLVLTYSWKNEFAFKASSKAEFQAALREALTQSFGTAIAFECVLEGKEGSALADDVQTQGAVHSQGAPLSQAASRLQSSADSARLSSRAAFAAPAQKGTDTTTDVQRSAVETAEVPSRVAKSTVASHAGISHPDGFSTQSTAEVANESHDGVGAQSVQDSSAGNDATSAGNDATNAFASDNSSQINTEGAPPSRTDTLQDFLSVFGPGVVIEELP